MAGTAAALGAKQREQASSRHRRSKKPPLPSQRCAGTANHSHSSNTTGSGASHADVSDNTIDDLLLGDSRRGRRRGGRRRRSRPCESDEAGSDNLRDIQSEEDSPSSQQHEHKHDDLHSHGNDFSWLSFSPSLLSPQWELTHKFGKETTSRGGAGLVEGGDVAQRELAELAAAYEHIRLILNDPHRRSGAAAVSRGLPKNGKFVLVKFRPSWPPLRESEFAMRFDEPHSRWICSRLPEHAAVHRLYQQAVASGSIEELVALFQRYPWCMSAGLRLVDFLENFVRDSQQAAECLERCLYALECAMPVTFSPWRAGRKSPLKLETLYLPYSIRGEADCPNSLVHICLARHAQFLARRGLFRTALEVCKLGYALDPKTDTCGSLLRLDHYAWHSQGHHSSGPRFICSFFESQRPNTPNWLWSYALALHRLHLTQSDASWTKVADAVDRAILWFPLVAHALLETYPAPAGADAAVTEEIDADLPPSTLSWLRCCAEREGELVQRVFDAIKSRLLPTLRSEAFVRRAASTSGQRSSSASSPKAMPFYEFVCIRCNALAGLVSGRRRLSEIPDERVRLCVAERVAWTRSRMSVELFPYRMASEALVFKFFQPDPMIGADALDDMEQMSAGVDDASSSHGGRQQSVIRGLIASFFETMSLWSRYSTGRSEMMRLMHSARSPYDHLG